MPTPEDKLFEPRRYMHFDAPMKRKKLKARIKNPSTVASWRFYPLIKKEADRSKVHRPVASAKPIIKPKTRPICAAGHSDSSLYAYYAKKLTDVYEERLAGLGLEECATAFRSLGKSNIDFAKDAFDWIESHRPCVAMAFDVKGFFDSLDHIILKKMWATVLGETKLPADHFAIFRSLARYAYVDRDEVYKTLGVSVYNPRANHRKRLCTEEEFRKLVRPLIRVHNDSKGIPQGTPISAALSNIYMLDFDKNVAALISSKGGLYRRYCDDILCVVPPDCVDEVRVAVDTALGEIKLEQQDEKFSIHLYSLGVAKSVKPLQYLGLTYDGVDIRLRSTGFGRYYNKMRSGVRAAKGARNKAAIEAGVSVTSIRIHRKKINQKFSYLGRRNFVSYALSAAKKTQSKAIFRQIKRHWGILNRNVEAKETTP
jgi:hypothetical protein